MTTTSSGTPILEVGKDTDGLFYPFSFRGESVHKLIADAIGQLARESLAGAGVQPPNRPHPGATRPIPSVSARDRKHGSHLHRDPDTGNWESFEQARRRLVDGLLLGFAEDSNDIILMASDVEAVREAFRPMVEDQLLVVGSRRSYPLIVPVTLMAGYYSGVENSISAGGRVILEMIDASDPDRSAAGSPLLGRLAHVLSSPARDLVCNLTDSLIGPDPWPISDRDKPLRLTTGATDDGGQHRRILPVIPAHQLATDVRALLDAYDDGRIDRQDLYRLFGSLASLRLAQYITACSVMASRMAQAIRRIVTSDYSFDAAELGRARILAVTSVYGLELKIGESVYRTLQEPLEGYLRDIRLILLARIQTGTRSVDVGSNPSKDGKSWTLDAACDLLNRLVELGREGHGLRPQDLEAHDAGETVPHNAPTRSIKGFETIQALLKWQCGAFSVRRGRSTIVFPSDDLLLGLVLVNLEGDTRMLFEDFVDRLARTGIVAVGPAREAIAQRLTRMGLLTEMPDAERFREIVIA